MEYNLIYLPSIIPQWEIFVGIVCVIIGYVEKKEKWMSTGWIILIATGLTSVAFNLFGGFNHQAESNIPGSAISALLTIGWQSAMGGAIALMSILFQRMKNKYFKFIALLTLICFMLIFFQFNHLTRSQSMVTKSVKQNEQSR